eukprot:144299_1
MLTLLFTILLTLTQSEKNGPAQVCNCGPGRRRLLLQQNAPDCNCGRRRLLQNAAVPLPTATEAAGNGAGNAAGAGATEMECIVSNKDPAFCACRTKNMVNPTRNFKLKCGEIFSCS